MHITWHPSTAHQEKPKNYFLLYRCTSLEAETHSKIGEQIHGTYTAQILVIS